MRRLMLAAGAAVLAFSLVGCGASDDEMNRFRSACSERGGFLTPTGPGGPFTVWVECVKDNKIVYLPGFA